MKKVTQPAGGQARAPTQAFCCPDPDHYRILLRHALITGRLSRVVPSHYSGKLPSEDNKGGKERQVS